MHLQDTSNKTMPGSACILNDTRVDTDPCSLVFSSSSEIKMYPLSPFGMQTLRCFFFEYRNRYTIKIHVLSLRV